jgi:ubiquitin carboxyl-terminal hydrolase L3
MPEIWAPLESNPEVITEYAASLGLEKNVLSFCDILSTEEWALDMVPRPVHAVVMVYPIKDESEARSKSQRERIEKDGQTVAEGLYYMKQTVPNACGTVAILHAIGNLPKDLFDVVVTKDSFLEKFFSDTKGDLTEAASSQKMDPDAIAKYLEEDKAIDSLHGAASAQGQSEVPPENLTNNHFVCFCLVNDCVYELDGRKEFPINHGTVESILGAPAAGDNSMLLESAIAVIQKEFMAPDPEELRFTFIALAAAGSD